MIRERLAAGLTLCAAVLFLAPSSAEAQSKSFKIDGAGISTDGIPLPGGIGPHWAIGRASDSGWYYGSGEVETLTATFNSDGTITGTFQSPIAFVFNFGCGDKLACYYGNPEFGASTVGTFTLVPVPGVSGWYVAYWIAEFVPYGPECTGKFKGVTGGWTMYATSDPFQLGATDPVGYSWYGKGTLNYHKGH